MRGHHHGITALKQPDRIEDYKAGRAHMEDDLKERLPTVVDDLTSCLGEGRALDQMLAACAGALDSDVPLCAACKLPTVCTKPNLEHHLDTLNSFSIAPPAMTIYEQPQTFEARGRQRVEGPLASEALCVLTRVQGAFLGGGESASVTHGEADDARWVLETRQGDTRGSDDVRATMTCVPRALFWGEHSPTIGAPDTFATWRATNERAQSEQDHRDADIVALAGVRGVLYGAVTEYDVEWLDTGGYEGTIEATALFANVAPTAPQRKLSNSESKISIASTQSYWRTSNQRQLVARGMLARADLGLCFLQRVSGRFESGDESVSLAVEQGHWVLTATSGCASRNLSGECTRVRRPAASASCYAYSWR